MILTSIINRHIQPNLLDKLQGSTIAFICTDFPNKKYIASFEEQLYIVDSISSEIDVTISSSLAGFIKYWAEQDMSNIQIQGNMEVAQTLQNLVGKIDIDWEEELSKYTGDIIAHQAMRLFKEYQGTYFSQMITEYLQEELKILPTKYEVEEFLSEVDVTRAKVDRLEARMKIHEVSS